jgi:hypothetical protein
MSAMTRRWRPLIVAGGFALVAGPAAHAEIVLPQGFTAQAYVTGSGFDHGTAAVAHGFPSASTLAFDHRGVLYLARTGRRYLGGDVDGLTPIYRVPLGGARLRADAEAQYFYGPPLWNPQVATVQGGRDLYITTFDRDRKVGVLYRIVDARAELVAGGTPPPGGTPLLQQPEGVAADSAGRLYVADRGQNVVIRLDASGRVLDPRWAAIRRPRLLAIDDKDQLWVGADGDAEAPWQRGPGEIWKVTAAGIATLVLRGPVPSGMGLAPSGQLFVADRPGARIFVLGPDGTVGAFAGFTDGDAPRGLGFAPVTPETRRSGIAGDLFVTTIRRSAWSTNEVVRISGPFDELRAGRP